MIFSINRIFAIENIQKVAKMIYDLPCIACRRMMPSGIRWESKKSAFNADAMNDIREMSVERLGRLLVQRTPFMQA